jgi:hypothetical protein
MPIDQYEDDDDKGRSADRKLGFKEFDCPSCSANNPCDPPFGHGDQLLCNYCGSEYEVRVTDDGRPKLREI